MEIIFLLENLLRIITTIISTGFSVQKIMELKKSDWNKEHFIFISSLIIGFLFGIMWNKLK
jgi:hypothetical protein